MKKRLLSLLFCLALLLFPFSVLADQTDEAFDITAYRDGVFGIVSHTGSASLTLGESKTLSFAIAPLPEEAKEAGFEVGGYFTVITPSGTVSDPAAAYEAGEALTASVVFDRVGIWTVRYTAVLKNGKSGLTFAVKTESADFSVSEKQPVTGPITNVSLSITPASPTVGSRFDSVSFVSSSEATVDNVMWKENSTIVSGGNRVFSPGNTYVPVVELRAAPGRYFTLSSTATLGGWRYTVQVLSGNGEVARFTFTKVTVVSSHTHSASEWSSDPSSHWRECSVCGGTFEKASHKWVSDTSGKAVCTVCGATKSIRSGNEVVSLALIDVPTLTVGSKLTAPAVHAGYTGQFVIDSYAWKTGNVTVAVGNTVQSGKTYSLTVTVRAKAGCAVDESTEIFVSGGNGFTQSAASVNKNAGTVTQTLTAVPYKAGKLAVTLPVLKAGMTPADLFGELKVTMNGGAFSGWTVFAVYEFDGQNASGEHYVKIGPDGRVTSSAGFDRIKPNTSYEMMLSYGGAMISAYGNSFPMLEYAPTESDITITNASSFREPLKTVENVVGLRVYGIGAIASSVSNLIPSVSVDLGTVSCNSASKTATLQTAHISVSSLAWSDTDGAHAASIVLKAEDGYSFPEKDVLSVLVNGVPAKVTASDGSTAAVTYEVPHKYGAWTGSEPTCGTDGTLERKCTVCGKTQTLTVEKTGHSLAEFPENEPTCVGTGLKAHAGCTLCGRFFDTDGKEIAEEDLILPTDPENHIGGTLAHDENEHWTECECGEEVGKEAHIPGEWITDEEPTAESAGKRHTECTVCGAAIVEELPRICLHERTERSGAFEPKCTEAGYTGDLICSDCGEVLENGEHLDMLGHDYGEDGVCTRCGQKKDGETEIVGTEPPGTEPGTPEEPKKAFPWYCLLFLIPVFGILLLFLRKKKKSE
ncbi:MAG: hypothetical protein MJ070_05300 [Lachnospiraceae bacterium]|nr:hypothetical protein [Lachnospiraceae bacterium]